MSTLISPIPGLRLEPWCGGFLLLFCIAAPSWAEDKAQPQSIAKDHSSNMAKGLEIFKKDVKAVLTHSCVKCHGGKDDLKGNLDLTTREKLLKGGDLGPAVIIGKGKESLIYKLLTHARDPHMPKGGRKLPDDVIARIAEWIDMGAPYDGALVARTAANPAWTDKRIAGAARAFWAFQPLGRIDTPSVKDGHWPRTRADRFILAELEANGLAPNPPAEKRALIRRAYFDLIGLPPSAHEVEAFVNDPRPDAFDRLVNRLLASPHYGERWGRHWLDLARFAESHGFEHDYDRPSAFHYRDFVIEALNRDLPFDTFIKWQIAGDEYAPENPLALQATGFLAAGVHSTQITQKEVAKHRYDEMDDMLATIGTAMLGLTIGCARCHDHKFDPIPQGDYYRLLSTFTTTVRSEVDVRPAPPEFLQAKAAFDRQHAALLEARAKFEKENLAGRLAEWEKTPHQEKAPNKIAAILKVAAAERSTAERTELLQWYRTIDSEWKKLNQQVTAHQKKAPTGPKMLISTEGLAAVRLHTQGGDFFKETHYLRRGDPDQQEGIAAQSFLQALMPKADAEKRWQRPPPPGSTTSYRRRALAEWLTDVEAGAGQLVARVIVNRLWQHHMGKGIVATPNDFGERGERPSHPELLDYLAGELIRGDWRLKPIHALIMTSAVYRQSIQFDEQKAKVDRDNRLLWRRPVRRLEAEVIRDSLLSVCNLHDSKMFGPGTLDESSKRRSIYFTVKRSRLMPMIQVFDAPDGLSSIGDRPTTTIAPQALWLMNNVQVRGCARGFAQRIATYGTVGIAQAVEAGYVGALARKPNADEWADSVAFVKRQIELHRKNMSDAEAHEHAFADFCQVLFCLNEFVYVD